jgi:hypothetical protein
VRLSIYMALVGAACMLLLLPLRGALGSAPTWAVSPRVVMAREGLYTYDLLPGESRTYVLEMAGRSLLKVRFSGSGNGLGLRIEDGEGAKVGAMALDDPSTPRDHRLGVVNSAGTAQTLYLTVFRSGEPARRRLVQPKSESAPRFYAGNVDVPLPGVSQGTYSLELARDSFP